MAPEPAVRVAPGFLAYRLHAGVRGRSLRSRSVHRGAPLGLVGAFADTVHAQGLAPCLFTVASEASDEEKAQRSHGLRIAEEAQADLPTLDLVGKSRQDVRTALNQRASSAY